MRRLFACLKLFHWDVPALGEMPKYYSTHHARIHKVLSEGVQLCNSDGFFYLMMGERIQIPQKAGHHQPVSETPFKWHFAGVPMMAQL